MGAKRATSRFRSAIADQQLAAAAEIVAIEAAWSQRASEFPRPASERAIDSAAQNILIFGIPLALAWAHNRDDFTRRAGGILREVAAGQTPPETILPRILGAGPPGRETGGLIQQAARNADALVHTTVSEAATDARLPVWKANGVNAFRWHAVLDEKTTAGCALRHGLLYELDTLEPIRHSVPIEREPPRHYRCRSILLPMAYADDIPMPEDGGQSSFREYFDSLTEAEQDRLFGQGRADLFRRGVITQSDLVGQNGQVLSLAELREIHGKTPQDFVASAIATPRERQLPLPLDLVSRAAADRSAAIGVVTEGKRIALDHDGVIHAIRQHGGANEALRGQAPIDAEDIARFDAIFNASVLRAGDPPVARDGTRMLAGEVELFGWRYTFAAKVRRRDVVLHTLYKRRGRAD